MKIAKTNNIPDNTAERTALWRALHLQVDVAPFIIEDVVGLKLIAPEAGWQERPDMKYTKRIRASILARARFIEDLIIEQNKKGIEQYIILGSGLDSFAQRHPDLAIQIFEIDQSKLLEWKKMRLIEIGYPIPENLYFVPVDFENEKWNEQLIKSGFDIKKEAVIVCTGVTLYLSKAAILESLHQIAAFATGSVLAITFYLPLELLHDEDRPMQEIANKGAMEAGTPFISFFTPEEIIELANFAGLQNPRLISTKDMNSLYFKNRLDNLFPATGEVFLLAEID